MMSKMKPTALPAPVPQRKSNNGDASEDEAYNVFFRCRAGTRTACVLVFLSLSSINVRNIATAQR